MKNRTSLLLASALLGWAGSSSLFGAGYDTTVLADRPVGYWRLDETGPTAPPPAYATNLGSLAPSGDGTYINPVTFAQPGVVAGDPDTSVTFDGARQTKLDIPFTPELNPPAFTVEFWAKVTGGTGYRSPVTSRVGAAGSQAGYIFYASPANVWEFWTGTGSAWNNLSGGPVRSNEWVYLVGTYDGTTLRFYTNGVLASSRDGVVVPNAVNPLRVGAGASEGAGSFFFTGGVDEVAVYSTALADFDVLAHYQAAINGSGGYAAAVLGSGPVGYWRLGEPAPPAFPTVYARNLGSAGISANGTYLNGVETEAPGALIDDPNTAARFDGANDKVEIPFTAALNASTTFTFECWAKVLGGGANYRSPISSRDDAPQRGYIFYATPGNQWEFWSGTGGGWQTLGGAGVVDGEWAHLVGTYDGQYKSFYVNGVLLSLQPVVFSPNAARPLRIGAGATENPVGNYFFNGDVDEVAVYDKVLSQESIAAHYTTGSGNPPPAVAPTITLEPVGTNVFEGATVVLSVRALGAVALRYQWYNFNTPVPSGTNATLVLSNVTVLQAGSYYAEVSNDAGTANSASVEVIVTETQMPTIVQDPISATIFAGGRARFVVQAVGSVRLAYQWQFKGANLPGATNAVLTIPNVQAANAGDYQVSVRNTAGSVPSAVATLTVVEPAPGSYPTYVLADRPVAYWRLGEADGPIAYDMFGGYHGGYSNTVSFGQSGAILDDPDTSAGFDGASGTKVDVPFAAELNPQVFSVECWAKVTGAAGNYRSPLTSRDDFPQQGFIFYAAPNDQWQFWTGTGAQVGWNNIPGTAVQYDTWTYLAATYDGTTKRFYINGVQVGSSTSAYGPNDGKPLRIGGGATDNVVGNFFMVGSVDEVAVYNTVLPPDRIATHYLASFGVSVPPSVTVEPVSRAVLPGTDLSLSVAAMGSLPLLYQWQFNETNLPQQTNRTLALPNVQSSQAGDYRVIIRNPAGAVTSQVATVTVVIVPNVAYDAAVLADNPVAYWRLSETSGDVAMDELGNHHGAYLNAPALGLPGAIPDDPNPAAGFTASVQTKVDVPYSADLNPPQFTIECWAKVTGAGGAYRSPLTSRADLPQRGYIFYAEPGNTWQFWTGSGQSTGWDTLPGPAVQLDTWTHLLATYDGVTKRFYVNATEVASSTAPFGPNDASPLRIGGGASEGPGNFFFEGSVDEVAVYNTVLPADRVLIHHALGSLPTLKIARVGNNVVVTWNFGQTLEVADNLAGPWLPVPNATSPLTITSPVGNKFYRMKR